jgi:hypothetical protein
LTLGNAFRGGVFRLNDNPSGPHNVPLLRVTSRGAPEQKHLLHVGNIIENVDLGKSSLGISHGDAALTLTRNNVLRLMEEHESTGARIGTSGDAILSGNRYINADRVCAETALPRRPIALHRVAHFSGKVGEDLGGVTVPIANAGTREIECEAVSENEWVSLSMEGHQTLAAESIGYLIVRVNTVQLDKGVQSGRVRLRAPKQDVVISVRVSLQ